MALTVGTRLGTYDILALIGAGGMVEVRQARVTKLYLAVAATPDSPPFGLSTGVTTLLDAGTRGADGVLDAVAVARTAPNRMRVLLNLARTGIAFPPRPDVPNPGELLNWNNADAGALRAAIEAHRDIVVGVKVRVSRTVAAEHDLDAIVRAKTATAGLGLPLMVHIGDSVSPFAKIL